MSQKSSQKGFTIIEVVLVLAIAALIFLVVFLAVPALQRSQRDTQRRADVGRLVTAVTSYAGNHQGALPPSGAGASGMTNNGATGFVAKYLRAGGDSFTDPSRGDYNISAGSTTVPAATATFNGAGPNGEIYYAQGHKCNADGTLTTTGAGTRNFAAVIVLENNDIYCQDN